MLFYFPENEPLDKNLDSNFTLSWMTYSQDFLAKNLHVPFKKCIRIFPIPRTSMRQFVRQIFQDTPTINIPYLAEKAQCVSKLSHLHILRPDNT